MLWVRNSLSRRSLHPTPGEHTSLQHQHRMCKACMSSIRLHIYTPKLVRSANNFVKARLQTFIYRLFKKRGNQQRVRISDICSAFPSQSETSIRKRLKDCSDFQRGGDDSGWWTLKKDFAMPSEDDLRAMLTPETVCAYESMLAGLQRLQVRFSCERARIDFDLFLVFKVCALFPRISVLSTRQMPMGWRRPSLRWRRVEPSSRKRQSTSLRKRST